MKLQMNYFQKDNYGKYPNLVCTQVEIISDASYPLWKIIFKAPNLVRTPHFSRNLKEEKVLELRSNLFFLFHKKL